jgi:hypothetical protein
MVTDNFANNVDGHLSGLEGSQHEYTKRKSGARAYAVKGLAQIATTKIRVR